MPEPRTISTPLNEFAKDISVGDMWVSKSDPRKWRLKVYTDDNAAATAVVTFDSPEAAAAHYRNLPESTR